MTLICTKCGSGSRIEHEGKDLHCKFCGEKEVFDTMKKKCRKCNKKNALTEAITP